MIYNEKEITGIEYTLDDFLKMRNEQYKEERKHSHYHKKCPYDSIDVYRVLELFEVTNPCLQHAIKKLLVAGGRGSKDINKDVQEAIDTLNRWIEMRREDETR